MNLLFGFYLFSKKCNDSWEIVWLNICPGTYPLVNCPGTYPGFEKQEKSCWTAIRQLYEMSADISCPAT